MSWSGDDPGDIAILTYDAMETLALYGQPRGEEIFQKDGEGRVVRLVDRRDNNDLVWKRVRSVSRGEDQVGRNGSMNRTPSTSRPC